MHTAQLRSRTPATLEKPGCLPQMLTGWLLLYALCTLPFARNSSDAAAAITGTRGAGGDPPRAAARFKDLHTRPQR